MVQRHHHQALSRTEDVLSELDSFEQLQLPSHILSALKAAGFVRPSPVQQHAIPIAALGLDALVQSKSGTGKTLVYAITILLRVDASLPVPQARSTSTHPLLLSPHHRLTTGPGSHPHARDCHPGR